MLLFSILFRCARWFFMLHFSPSSAHFSHILRIQTFLSFRRLCSATLSVTTFAVGSIQCGSYVYSGDRFLLLLLLLRMEFSGDSLSKTDLHKKKTERIPEFYLAFSFKFHTKRRCWEIEWGFSGTQRSIEAIWFICCSQTFYMPFLLLALAFGIFS